MRITALVFPHDLHTHTQWIRMPLLLIVLILYKLIVSKLHWIIPYKGRHFTY